MTTGTSKTDSEIILGFAGLSTDQKLALLWFIYQEVGKSITPAAPGASTAAPAIAEGLFKQVLEMSQEEQLQVQRDLVMGTNSLVSREYGALSDTTKLLFWYLLAQGMDRSEIIPMPNGYGLEPAAAQCLGQLQQLSHAEQITVLRSWVTKMGVDPSSSPHDKSTGL
jgi:Orange carotenoid protein, N-terminal